MAGTDDNIPADELLTVAQVCARLPVSERTLRRVLAEPGQAAQIVAVTRQVNGRTRQVAMIGPALLSLLQARFQDAGKETSGGEGAGGGQDAGQAAGPVAMPVLAYQRLIAEQAARIADLQAALASERANSRQNAEQVARAQTLLALTASPEPPRLSFWQRLFGGRKAAT